jgi:dihydrofolate reductase
MIITLIAAAAENDALGKDNQMIWHLPDDFKRFKQLTTGHHIIMGRKTFESLPGILPNRKHVIITRQKDYEVEGCIIVNSLDAALLACQGDNEVFIIGGGEIFTQSMEIADKIELTRVYANSPEADAFFPEIDPALWKLIEEVFHPKDEKHKFDMAFQTFVRRQNTI